MTATVQASGLRKGNPESVCQEKAKSSEETELAGLVKKAIQFG